VREKLHNSTWVEIFVLCLIGNLPKIYQLRYKVELVHKEIHRHT